jgi:hypothetical protein
MRTLEVSYRPYPGTLMLWVEESDEQNDFIRDDEENWHLSLGMVNGQFASMVALGVREEGRGWDTWLSFYLPDSTVARIAQFVENCDDTFLEAVKQPPEGMLTVCRLALAYSPDEASA